jgi:hypothetical protein
MTEKLAIVVPYQRQERASKKVPSGNGRNVIFLNGIDYEILIVEQEEGKPFNRGKLLNIGAIESSYSKLLLLS